MTPQTRFGIVYTPQADSTTAQALSRQYPAPSSVGATIAAYTGRTESEHPYSFDDDLNRVGRALDRLVPLSRFRFFVLLAALESRNGTYPPMVYVFA